MHISYGPDSNVITDSQGRAVYLSDNELDLLARSLAKNAVDATVDGMAPTEIGRVESTSDYVRIGGES